MYAIKIQTEKYVHFFVAKEITYAIEWYNSENELIDKSKHFETIVGYADGKIPNKGEYIYMVLVDEVDNEKVVVATCPSTIYIMKDSKTIEIIRNTTNFELDLEEIGTEVAPDTLGSSTTYVDSSGNKRYKN
jgi:hypothetical protein